MQELIELRQRLFNAIYKVTKFGCKHYEGAMHLNMPNAFEDREDHAEWHLDIDLYVFGPSRRLRIEACSYKDLCSRLEVYVKQYEREAKEANQSHEN